MKVTLTFYEVQVATPEAMPSDLLAADYDAATGEIVINFRDGKVARVPASEFEELAKATVANYRFLDGIRAGITWLTAKIDFALATGWWRERIQ